MADAPKTFVGGTVSYAQPADFLIFADAQVLGDLADDTGDRVTPSGLLTDPRLAAALQAASGRVEKTLLQSGRYTVADLLSIPSGSNVSWRLKEIVCGLAVQTMVGRRLYETPTGNHPLYERSLQSLRMLSDGDETLPFAETIAAGVPTTEQLQRQDWNVLPLVTNNTRAWPQRRTNPTWGSTDGDYGGF